MPSIPDTEKSFDELKARLANTIDYVKAFKPAQFDGADARDVTFPAGPDKTMTMKGQQFLSHFSLPNFYFHAVTAHDILRHNGVEIGKRDFLGVVAVIARSTLSARSPPSREGGCDEAIQIFELTQAGLLRCARNDVDRDYFKPKTKLEENA